MTFCRFSGVPLSRFCGLYVFLLENWNARKAAIHDASSSPGDGGMLQAGRAQSVPPIASGRCRCGSSVPPLSGRSAHTEAKDSEATPDRLALSRLDRSSFSSPEETAIRGRPGAEEWLRRRPLSGATAVGMARLGGLDAEYSVQTERDICPVAVGPRDKFYNWIRHRQTVVCVGCRTSEAAVDRLLASGRAGGPGRRAASRTHPAGQFLHTQRDFGTI